jgi:hypothetical protein
VPHYEGLTVESFLERLNIYPQVKEYFPDKFEERKKLPRTFIINTIFTIVGEPFQMYCKKI